MRGPGITVPAIGPACASKLRPNAATPTRQSQLKAFHPDPHRMALQVKPGQGHTRCVAPADKCWQSTSSKTSAKPTLSSGLPDSLGTAAAQRT